MIRKVMFVLLPMMCITSAAIFISGCEEEKGTMQMTDKVENKTTQVLMETSKGNIAIELDAEAAPVTVENFLGYVNSGYYAGTIFHRVIPGFMIQGGGFDEEYLQKQTEPEIINEASNGLKNDRGTIAMARTNNPNSATSQFFINVNNNNSLNYSPGNPGYAVFGKVVEGMDVVDAIVSVKTTTKTATVKMGQKVPMQNFPMDDVVIKSIKVVTK